jgi:hypothetical protein
LPRRLLAPITLAIICLGICTSVAGQDFAGALGAISTLSADGRFIVNPANAEVSLYKPQNGPGLDLFFGRHLSDTFSLQADYLWNRNALTLVSLSSSPQAQSAYQETRSSSESGVLGDLLVYFRNRRSFLRPYLSVGAGFVHLSSAQQRLVSVTGTPALPPPQFASTVAALRVAVGMDVMVVHGWAFRYSFSETASHNPISDELSPPGERGLKNFQNLFGFVKRF